MGLASIIPAAIGLIQQQDSNRRSERDAQAARNEQKAIAEKQAKAYEERLKLYKGLVAAGAYDEAQSFLKYDGNLAAQQNQALGNQSAAAATMGYKPGDSAPIQSLRDTSAAFARQSANDKFQIKQNLQQRQQEDLRGTDPNALSSTAGLYGNIAQNAQSQTNSLAPYIQSILTNPQLKTRTSTPTATSSISYAPPGVYDPNMPNQVDDGMGTIVRSNTLRPMPKKSANKRSNNLSLAG